ncbi:zinc ABC transporter substrate-binding protein [Natrinema zhouii]|uniref:Zinc ABC transporter substrate-binding protein n=1 Tax=Natrinema zhouii TaxID=1710539 RepID=A0A7D6H1T1_9EURY|nr:zinc ABC transporter substrate-binding protein [Natrinema zhouii]QLK25207.1 zinc ABC transporter substrate-binding protein [Natrinema zhouii]
MNVTRRALLKGGASAVAAGTVAGCLDDIDASSADLETGYAAFFTLWDWAEQVSGDVIEFENPVGTGQPGHGWSPGGDLTRDIADAGAFVYFDTPEFSWAQNIAATLETDYDAVTVIDGLEGLDDQLLGWDREAGGAGGHDGASHDDGHEHDDGHNHDGHDHDRSSIDPHVWLDPVLAQDIVDTIASGLADADPDNAETYEENAAAYADELAALDQRFEALVDAADRQTAVFAGHDSFTYLQERYGFELHTPTGVSPQEEPSQDAISATIDLVEEEGIETILYSPFEDRDGEYPPLVNTIIRDSSHEIDAMPITHLSGTLVTWQDEGWGYLEQMEEINVPAFREALDAQ